MDTTTIKLRLKTKSQLDKFREYRNESYDEVVRKIIFIAENSRKEPKVSKQTINHIERARERIKKGRIAIKEKTKRRLGL